LWFCLPAWPGSSGGSGAAVQPIASPPIEDRAIAAFNTQTFKLHASKEYTAIRRVKREKVGAPEKIVALLVFFLQRFGILTKIPCRLRLAIQL